LLPQSIGGSFGLFATNFGAGKVVPFFVGGVAPFNCPRCLSHTGNSPFPILLY